LCRLPRPRQRQSQEKARCRIGRREIDGTLKRELGRWRKPAGLIDERIAEPNPQKRIAGMFANSRLHDGRGPCRVAASSE
jgi:hypothetical protein